VQAVVVVVHIHQVVMVLVALVAVGLVATMHLKFNPLLAQQTLVVVAVVLLLRSVAVLVVQVS
jgi:hypothetical protein